MILFLETGLALFLFAKKADFSVKDIIIEKGNKE